MKWICGLLTVIFLSGCTQVHSGFVYEKSAEEITAVPYCLYTKSDKSKIYTGAYIHENRQDLQSIAGYEDFTGVSNDIYIISLNKDMEFPYEQVLECYGNNKIPMIIVSDEYNIGDLFFVAEKCGEYSLPMFVCVSCNNEENLAFYKNVRDIFKWAAPATEMVWCIPVSSSTDWLRFYPGSDYVDWIGLNFTESADDNGIVKNHTNMEFLIRSITDKPIMINAAVSHYSAANNRYYTYDTVKELEYIYGLALDYDNIQCINYINYPQADKYNKGDNFNIVPDQRLTEGYKNAQNLISENRYKRNKCVVYVYNEKLFACKSTIEELNMIYNSIDTIYIEGKMYYDISVNGLVFDEENQKIFAEY